MKGLTTALLTLLLLASCLPFRDEGVYACKPSSDATCSADCVCSVFATSTGEHLNAVWGSSANDIWAAGSLSGNQAIAHFDGKEWKRVALPIAAELSSLWGSSRTDVWAVGDQGTLLHFDGTAWSKQQSPTMQVLTSVSGTATDDVWAAGYFANDHKNLLHFDGTAWTLRPESYPNGLYAVLAFAADDVWASGVQWGSSFHFDGSAWRKVDHENIETARALFGVKRDDFWLAADQGLAHGDGAGFDKRLSVGSPLRAVWASGATDVWACGEGGQLWRGDGTKFTAVKSGVTTDLIGLWGSGPGDVYAVGAAGISRFHP